MEVEIWSDVACPWCYIGKRRFERALAEFEHAGEIEVSWRSFELDPDAPPEIPGSSVELLADKYGISVERAQEMNAHVSELAAAEGLQYDLAGQRLGSTFDAHRLIQLGREHGVPEAVEERLLRARLVEGALVSDPEVLVACGVEAGLDEQEVRALVASDRLADAVREDELTAQRLGIGGVPMFVVDRSLGASGAQPPELLLRLLTQGWENALAGAAER